MFNFLITLKEKNTGVLLIHMKVDLRLYLIHFITQNLIDHKLFLCIKVYINYLDLGREDFEHLHKKNSCPDYNKNSEFILKKTILMVPNLKSLTPRCNKVIFFYKGYSIKLFK